MQERRDAQDAEEYSAEEGEGSRRGGMMRDAARANEERMKSGREERDLRPKAMRNAGVERPEVARRWVRSREKLDCSYCTVRDSHTSDLRAL